MDNLNCKWGSYIYLTNEKRNLIIESLIAKKNELTSAGKYTDGVDDVLLKILQSKKKVKVIYT